MNTFKLIQIASHLGEHKDGVERGPESIVQAFVETSLFKSQFEKDIAVHIHPDPDPELEVGEYEKLKHLPQIVASYELAFTEVSKVVGDGFVPVSIIGSDEVAAPIFNAVAGNYSRAEVGIVWIDSHPDLNDASTTPSGNIHGMSLALALGQGDTRLLTTRPENGFNPTDAVLVGPGEADIDLGETVFINKHCMLHFTPDMIREKGAFSIAADVLCRLQDAGKNKLAIHFDLDSIDPKESPGVSVPAEDGNAFKEMYTLAREFIDSPGFEVVSFNLAEYNPTKDPNGVTLGYALEVLDLLG